MKYFTLIFLLCCAVAAKGSSSKVNPIQDEFSSGYPSSGSYSDLETDVGCFFEGEKHVKFYLHNHNDLDNRHRLKFNSTIASEWVNKEWKTVVFIHGWKGGHRLAEVMKNAYLDESNQKVNLIEVDWLLGAYNPLYCPSAKRVPNVGETVAKFIGLNKARFNLDKLIIVGHSLGAHCAGFAGKFLQSNYKFEPRLIVGLDPAGPFFRGHTEKLQPTDAKDVLVLHTSHVFGHLEPLGTVDVYINGGKSQPGCTDAQSHGFSKLMYKELVNGVGPLVGHRYTSFAEVMNDIVPHTEEIQLFHGAPLPPRGTLIYVSTLEQPHLIAEVKEYIDEKLHSAELTCSLSNCVIM